MFLLLTIGIYISTLPIYVSVYITTYANPKTAIATTSKSTPLMNTPLLLFLLLSGFEVHCGLNADCIIDVVGVDDCIVDIVGVDDCIVDIVSVDDCIVDIVGVDDCIVDIVGVDDCIVDIVGVDDCIVDIVDIDTVEYIADIGIDVHIVDIYTNEDIITEIKKNV